MSEKLHLIQHTLLRTAGEPLPRMSPIGTPDEFKALALWVENFKDAVDWMKAEIIRTAHAAGGPDGAFYLSPCDSHARTSLETLESELRATAREIATADDGDLRDAGE